MLQFCFLSKKKKKKKKGEDVTILRDIVTTSWSADHIGFLLLNIYLVGPTSWFCILFYIARSGLLQCSMPKTGNKNYFSKYLSSGAFFLTASLISLKASLWSWIQIHSQFLISGSTRTEICLALEKLCSSCQAIIIPHLLDCIDPTLLFLGGKG